MFSSFRKQLEAGLDAVEALAAQQINPRDSMDESPNPSRSTGPPPAPQSATPRRTAGMSLEERLRMKLAAAGTKQGDSSSGASPQRTATPPPAIRTTTLPYAVRSSPVSRTSSFQLPPLTVPGDIPPPTPQRDVDMVDPAQVALPQSPAIASPQELFAATEYSAFRVPPSPPPVPPHTSVSTALQQADDNIATPMPEIENATPAAPSPPVSAHPALPSGEDHSDTDTSQSTPPLQATTLPEEVTLPSEHPRQSSSASLQSPEMLPTPPTKSPTPTPLEADVVKEEPLPSELKSAEEITPALTEQPPSAPVAEEHPIPLSLDHGDDVEKLRERLKLVEQRFSDVSKSFKRLQAEKVAADKVLKEFSPLDGIADVDGLRQHLRNIGLKNEMSLEEIKRLNTQIRQHDGRLEDLRDIHHLESRSQSDQIDSLRRQLKEAEALIAATSTTTSNIEATSSARQATIDQLTADLEKAKTLAKEEEEKRGKAIALLKTVRQKLVKSEKDREDQQKEQADLKADREVLKTEVANCRAEIERVRSEKEKDVANLRVQFDRELIGAKERFDREASAKKAQYELDAITTKAAHTKELTSKNNRIAQLEASIRTLTSEKDGMFDQLQMRQAELESSQYQLEALTNENRDLQFRLREGTDKLAQLNDEVTEARTRGLDGAGSDSRPRSSVSSHPPTPSPAPLEVARLLSEAEGKYEARLSEMRSRLRALEKERVEAEEEWGKNLSERSKEVERLRQAMKAKEEEIKNAQLANGEDREREQREKELQSMLESLKLLKKSLSDQLAATKKELERVVESEMSLREEKIDAVNRMNALEKQMEEAKAREVQWKANNKTLREELRKVQTSAALLEKQRNPGVGYWSNSPRSNAETPTSPRAAANGSVQASSPGSPRPSTPTNGSSGGSSNDEEVNLEYLRNVILQFLEHKEMRPNLIRVLSIILHFTPQETRRLIAKV